MLKGLIVLLPYSPGQEFHVRNLDDKLYKNKLENKKDNSAFLPVYVDTQNEQLALIAVAYEACVNNLYVACPSSEETREQWKDLGYPGTLQNPGVDLPTTEEAFEIPEAGDGFCCASLENYRVVTTVEMLKLVQSSPNDFIPEFLEENDNLWEQFNDWCIEVLNYSLYSVN